jgi:cell division septal protein FtsQ
VAVSAYSLGWSRLMSIQKIEIHAGAEQQLIQQALVPSEIATGQPLARINVAHIDHALTSYNWIQAVSISRNWITRAVTVKVTPRTPVAQFQSSDGTVHYLDLTGTLFELPVTPPNVPAITFVTQDFASRKLAATLLSGLPKDLVQAMSSLVIASENWATMTLSLDKHPALTVQWGDASSIPLKVSIFRHLLALPENRKIHDVDLSIPLSPVVK